MKLAKKMSSAALATAIAMGSMVVAPVTAQADMSAGYAVSNMYLWRGQNISTPYPAVSGSIDYSHASGFYAGIWGSSEGVFDGSSETDLYLGFGGEVGGFSYDVSYVKYLYPGATDGLGNPVSMSDSALSDVIVGLGYGPVSFTYYAGVESDSTKDIYYTLAFDYSKFTFLYGKYEGKNAASGADYSHLQVSYAATDNLSFTISKASDDGYGLKPGTLLEEDPLFQVTYGQSFDL